jgi:hypothetical protein
MNPFSGMHTDTVYIEKSDGRRIGPFKTRVGKDSATIFEENLDVFEGDKLVRSMVDRPDELYEIVDVHYSSGLQAIGPHYSLKYRKITAYIAQHPSAKPTTNITITNSTGFQVGDHNILNIQHAIAELVQRIDAANGTPEEKENAKGLLASFFSHPLVTAMLGGVAGNASAILALLSSTKP